MSEHSRPGDAWAYGPAEPERPRARRVPEHRAPASREPRRRWTVPAAAAALVLLVASVAFADVLVVDGDGLEPVTSNPLDFGEVCVGETVSKNLKLAVARGSKTGAGNFANGSTVVVSFAFDMGSSNGSATYEVLETEIVLPDAWQTFPQGTTSAPVKASATLKAKDTGPYTATALFRATGVGGDGRALTATTSLPVVGSIVDCAPQESAPTNRAPSLQLPGDRVVEGNTTGGALAAFEVSASDPEDGALEPECSKASGDHFPLGTTTVSCSATDSDGESVAGSFDVTVVDTIPPQLKGVPGDITVTATKPAGAVVEYEQPTAKDIVDPAPVVSCAPGAGTLFPPGTTQVTCSASDASGNASAASFLVTVSFDWVGFLPPYGTGRAEVRAGSTVPVKWWVGDGGGGWIASLEILDLGASAVQSCGEASPTGNLARHTTGGTWLRSAGGQFVYNWNVPSEPGACYQVRVAFADGDAYVAQFRVR